MVIGFKKQFIPLIKSGKKIHTIREDKHGRWKQGVLMDMATGVRTKKYKCFCKKYFCISTQKIKITYFDNIVHQWAEVYIDDKKLSDKQIDELAINDGFNGTTEFFKWFSGDFKGKIINWTHKKYE